MSRTRDRSNGRRNLSIAATLGLAAAVVASSIAGASNATADAGAGESDGIAADVQPLLSEQLGDLGAAVTRPAASSRWLRTSIATPAPARGR